ncbi:MAG: hypothetical protein COW08_08870 [Ignavibacteriales bacterium CG12_big_fil_rev_8_21_14_0_65_30_8]|nr:MAG: hypothetical protein COW08_08870 [Ignavibacteriales bacterium CG12_big_fil_rev_8_21_14_0_65_30_8]
MLKKNYKRIVSVVGVLLVGIVIMIALGSTEKESNKRDLLPETRTVATQTLTFENMNLEITGYGTIRSQNELNVITEASGKILFAKNNLKSGTFVKKGELVVAIDQREIENNLYSLRSNYLKAIASLLAEMRIENEAIYKKWSTYFESINIEKPIPELPKDLTAREKIKLSARDILTKFYDVKNQEILLTKYKITAPFDGYLESNGIVENSIVSKGMQLFKITDAKNLEIAIPLLTEDINMIDFSKNPSVKLYSEKSDVLLKGRIIRKETNIQKNSQTLDVFVAFRNENLNTYFLPGNYIRTSIQGKYLKNVALVPRHLVDNDNYVYTMVNDKLDRIKVDIITIQNNFAVVKNTVTKDTRIVTTILQKPLLGMRLKSINESLKLNTDGQNLNSTTVGKE